MKKLLTLLTAIVSVVLISTGCTYGQYPYNEEDDLFKKRYQSLIPQEEEIVASWFYYVKSKHKAGYYIVRTIFPETKVITSCIAYADKNCKKKNGKALYFKDDGTPYKEGTFKNDKLDGYWKYYNPRSNVLSSEGAYINGKSEGLWIHYDSKGRKSKEINHKNDKREGLFYDYDTLGIEINTGEYKNDTIFRQANIKPLDASVNPEFRGCEDISNDIERKSCAEKKLLKYVYSNIKYPMDAREYGLEVMVVVFFEIGKDGKVTNVVIPNGRCQSIKKEILTLMEKMPDWKPGMIDNKLANVSCTLPISFKLE